MTKLNKKINEAEIYIGDKKEIKDIKPQLEPTDKLFVMGDKLTETEDTEETPMIVQFVSEIKGENPFQIGDIKWQYVKAKYPNGKIDIGVYRFGHDLVYGYKWFKDVVLSQANENSSMIRQEARPEMVEADETGIEGRNMDELKNDVEQLLKRLDLGPIKMALRKINTPIEQYEVIAKFAELIGVPRNKLSKLIIDLRDITTESQNPRMSKKGLLEHIKKIKNKTYGRR